MLMYLKVNIMKKVRLVEQTTPTECGLCCLYMILEYLGIKEGT